MADALARGASLDPLCRASRATVQERYDLRTACLPAQLALVERLLGRSC